MENFHEGRSDRANLLLLVWRTDYAESRDGIWEGACLALWLLCHSSPYRTWDSNPPAGTSALP